ncbi:Co2+/Mg2+ efflux protein ApaG [Pajaroellobacter abortibovis]|uniref:Protein ApaG n=1 Tax=Pajaroellobacter abortibovis TaxID=1882918 RepID=A0A1L6MWD8_9BACT|nr:Co2+/Mg2+ efflux protein ApaG [Pajaroellobacter abortibovis]APR99841.1 Co2+/Mg2+ efflux protein ApaG [Pajaroellobacter abortibovis]
MNDTIIRRNAFGTSTAITRGIWVSVKAVYVPDQSIPCMQQYVFAYTIRIVNKGTESAHLHSRHWIVSDSNGRMEKVQGAGVVGQQPYLQPGDSFEYTSGCVLQSPRGWMEGSYQMHRPDGSSFEAAIARFELALPPNLN